LGALRQGLFQPGGVEALLAVLREVDVGASEGGRTIDRRLVALSWFIPTFMGWQRERVRERGGDVGQLDVAINKVVGVLLERVLGAP